MLRAKDIFFEFLETVFLIALILFFIFYLFLGGYANVAKKIMQTLGIMSIGGMLFIIRLKIARYRMRKFEKESQDEDVVAYISRQDRIKDKIAIAASAFLLLPAAYLGSRLNSLDVIQALSAVFYMFLWRLFLYYNKDKESRFIPLNKKDEINDRTAIFFLPLVLLAETFFAYGADIADIFQVMLVFSCLHFWHRKFFKLSEYKL